MKGRPRNHSASAIWRHVLGLALTLALLAAAVNAQTDECYAHDKAYVAGNMNIRQRPSTGSSVVAKASWGDSFDVIRSQQGVKWCWLEIDKGWIAKTSRVRSSAPTQAPSTRVSQSSQPSQLPSNVDNCCFVNRQCNTDDEWTRGYWAFQNNECPVSTASSGSPPPSIAGQGQEPPPTRGEGFAQPIPGSGGNFFEFLAEGEYTTASVRLSAGTWNLRIITAATTLVYAESPVDKCLRGWRSSRVLVASKYHNIFGGNNEANGQFAVTRDCFVRFYVWAPRHRWSLEISKA